MGNCSEVGAIVNLPSEALLSAFPPYCIRLVVRILDFHSSDESSILSYSTNMQSKLTWQKRLLETQQDVDRNHRTAPIED